MVEKKNFLCFSFLFHVGSKLLKKKMGEMGLNWFFFTVIGLLTQKLFIWLYNSSLVNLLHQKRLDAFRLF